jgi:acetyl-CoA acetyltransferase
MVYDGLWDVYNDFHMGNTGELVAEKYVRRYGLKQRVEIARKRPESAKNKAIPIWDRGIACDRRQD